MQVVDRGRKLSALFLQSQAAVLRLADCACVEQRRYRAAWHDPRTKMLNQGITGSGAALEKDKGEPLVKNETVVDLIKDLTAKLSAVAEEFNGRVAHAADSEPVDGEHEPSETALVARAQAVLADRRTRRQFLPAELFHEPAWDMLLALFVSRDDRQPMNIKALVSMSDAPVTTSQRWIEHLHKLKLIDRVIDPADRRRVEISLSHTGDQAMRAYLRSLLQR